MARKARTKSEPKRAKPAARKGGDQPSRQATPARASRPAAPAGSGKARSGVARSMHPGHNPQIKGIPGLSLPQPWAFVVVAGYCPIHLAAYPTDYRGPIAIHAGLSERDVAAGDAFLHELGHPALALDLSRPYSAGPYHPESVEKYGETFDPSHPYPMGCIVGVVEVVDCVLRRSLVDAPPVIRSDSDRPIPAPIWCEALGASRLPHAWVLEKPRRLEIPIACKGSTKFFQLPQDVLSTLKVALSDLRNSA